MDFITRQLTTEQEHQIQCLIDACQKAEPIQLGLPEDGDIYLFCRNMEGQIISCIIVCCVREDIWECYAYTHPGFRKRGLFSRLLDLLCLEAEKTEKDLMTVPVDLVFLLDGKSPEALAVVQSMEMNLWRLEYQMERRITAEDSSARPPALAGTVADSLTLPSGFTAMMVKRKKIREDGAEGWRFTALGEREGQGKDRVCLGHCRMLSYGDLRFYLYHVEIDEPFRGQGWGARLLTAVLAELPVGSLVFLHVSSDNPAAISLYKKTGFSTAQALSYYVY